MALFTADAHFVVYMNANDPKPTQELHSRDALAPVVRGPESIRGGRCTSSGRARSCRSAAIARPARSIACHTTSPSMATSEL